MIILILFKDVRDISIKVSISCSSVYILYKILYKILNIYLVKNVYLLCKGVKKIYIKIKLNIKISELFIYIFFSYR